MVGVATWDGTLPLSHGHQEQALAIVSLGMPCPRLYHPSKNKVLPVGFVKFYNIMNCLVVNALLVVLSVLQNLSPFRRCHRKLGKFFLASFHFGNLA